MSTREWSSKSAVVPLILSAVPVVLTVGAFTSNGYPFGGELLSNLLPALHARNSIAAGRLPVYTPLFYSGRFQFANPLWYGFYPLAWPLFVPSLPLTVAIKVVLILHLILPVVVTYRYAAEDFPMEIAVPLSLVWALPLASQVAAGHLEKVFAYPWLVLVAWQCRKWRLESIPLRTGLVAGAGLGMMLLAGGNYYFAYGCLLVACVTVANGAWRFGKFVIIGTTVGAPHLLSVVPLLLSRHRRPPLNYGLDPFDVIDIVSGLHLTPYATVPWVTQGYAVVGLPIVALAAGVLYYWIRGSDAVATDWVRGIAAALFVAWMLATATPAVYMLPAADILRVAARATILVAVCSLLLAVHGIDAIDSAFQLNTSHFLRNAIVLLLFVSVLMSSAGWLSQTHGGYATDITMESRVAATLDAGGCDSAWIESTPAFGHGTMAPNALAFALTEESLAVRATHYGNIGQSWTAREEGRLTFDVLLTPTPLPEAGPVPLTRSDHPTPIVVNISRSAFDYWFNFGSEYGTIHVYEAGKGCSNR